MSPIQPERGPACLLDYVYEMWVVGSQPATSCTLQKMSTSHLELHLRWQSGSSAGSSVPSQLIKMQFIHSDDSLQKSVPTLKASRNVWTQNVRTYFFELEKVKVAKVILKLACG